MALSSIQATRTISAIPWEATTTERQATSASFIVAIAGKNGQQKISPHTLYGCKVWEIMIQLMQLITPYRKENKYGTIKNERRISKEDNQSIYLTRRK